MRWKQQKSLCRSALVSKTWRFWHGTRSGKCQFWEPQEIPTKHIESPVKLRLPYCLVNLRLKEAQLSQSKKLAGRLRMTLNQWQLGVMNRLDEEPQLHVFPDCKSNCLEVDGSRERNNSLKRWMYAKKWPKTLGCEVVEAQDLELLDELHPWIERSRLDQRPDAAALLCLGGWSQGQPGALDSLATSRGRQEIEHLLTAFDALKTALEVVART